MKKLKYIKITSILALALVFFACEKDAPLEASEGIDSRRNSQVENPEECGVHHNSKKGSSDDQGVGTSNDKGEGNITDPGNDDDYDNEDPNPGNSNNNQ